MAIIYSPVKLVKLLMNAPAITDELKRGEAWFFSEAGKRAYEEAKTVAQKTAYFYEYLTMVARAPKNPGALHKIAYVMAKAMVGTPLELGSYPDILKAEKNPLVAYVKKTPMPSDPKYDPIYAVQVLRAFRGEQDVKDDAYLYASHAPYKKMVLPDEGDPKSVAAWRIERYILSMFRKADGDDVYIGPFNYNITQPANTNDGEDDE